MKTERLIITVVADVPACAYRSDTKEFVKEALQTWGGQRHPDDPLFESMKVIKVGAIKPRKPK